ncbi:helix-turn-helix transcriptional regulator [Corynebacterium epidermidicanis]|uniref:Putative transcriptional regulator n=1 Tax=Corynebacterium epidermidicanis TaxID=1050174 RepID=A0A0G3GUK2_9CORY|nr:metalloregulator ArsR/SmtB family transcription factor [Corynebacterium epidermidicanis]AKK03198.1 putative transcriptional regulator [Corynebacterium epidermidicanis]
MTRADSQSSQQPQDPPREQFEGRTRSDILVALLHHGPSSASFLGEHLGLAAAGVRRHLDILQAEGLIEVTGPRNGSQRGRGRPAKAFALTDAGRSQFGHDYDTLAALALTALRETGGDAAVREFARKRIESIVADIQPAGATEESIKKTANDLVAAFSRSGYAASASEAGTGVQICQHHCPISHVASEFPELCEAEHRAISELIGQHVQPLATIVDGHGICTTNIPLTPIKRQHPQDPGQGRSGS